MMHAPPHFGQRSIVVCAILAGAIVLLHGVSTQERVPPRAPLSQFPAVLAGWRGKEEPLPDQTVAAVGVDEYLNRDYANGAPLPVHLYIGYYETQRYGDTIHSPKNCLPGAGWNAVSSRRISFPAMDGRRLTVNEYVVQRGLERELVLYWYQSVGRVIASEYAAKMWMVVDAVKRNRTDGALVRINTPIAGDLPAARARAVQFAQTIFPHLGDFVPD